MRRLVSLGSVTMLFSLMVFGIQPQARAQEATPVTEVTFENATIEVGAFGPVPGFPSAPGEIGVLRLRFAPGGRLLVPADDPGTAIHFLDTGTMTIRFSAPVTLVHGEATMATPETQAQESIPANTAFTLHAGDAFVALGPSGGEFRNDGSEDAVMLIAVVGPVEAATPTP
jgi:hypothetical protein